MVIVTPLFRVLVTIARWFFTLVLAGFLAAVIHTVAAVTSSIAMIHGSDFWFPGPSLICWFR